MKCARDEYWTVWYLARRGLIMRAFFISVFKKFRAVSKTILGSLIVPLSALLQSIMIGVTVHFPFDSLIGGSGNNATMSPVHVSMHISSINQLC